MADSHHKPRVGDFFSLGNAKGFVKQTFMAWFYHW
jgi:hypothetical protein